MPEWMQVVMVGPKPVRSALEIELARWRRMGEDARLAGVDRAPALDPVAMANVDGPVGSNTEHLRAWLVGWDRVNLAIAAEECEPNRYCCKTCGAESPVGIGYAAERGSILADPEPGCPGPHAANRNPRGAA